MGSCMNFIPNKAVHIKDASLPHVRIRNWIIQEILSNGHLLLRCEGKNYTLEVMKEDVEVKCCPK